MRSPPLGRAIGWLALGATGLFLAVFLILPLGLILIQGLSGGGAAIGDALDHPVYRQGLRNSAAIAVWPPCSRLAWRCRWRW
jgi:ABC-type sulfate transport system permease component